ncbi:phosphatase PAP2 family protein, partial [Staphylococcus epidermidis]
ELDHLFKLSLITFIILFIPLQLLHNFKHLSAPFTPYQITHKPPHFTHSLTINPNTPHTSFPSAHTPNPPFLMFIPFYF